MAKVTGLSGNEIYCLALKQYSPGELVVGNSINSMGFIGSLGAGVRNALGGEVTQVTQAIHSGRYNSFVRMVKEAKSHGANGVAGGCRRTAQLCRQYRVSFRGLMPTFREKSRIFYERW